MCGTVASAAQLAGPLRVIVVLAFLASASARAAEAPIRLGWQIPWATQGQLVMGLMHTNIPELTGIRLDFKGFAYGAPLNQAALAGDIDVLLTADQPAITLISRSPRFRIVARMMYNRVCLYVPPKSAVSSVSDLAGGAVGGPIGAAAEHVALSILAEAGLREPVRLRMMDMPAQAALLRGEGAAAEKWSGVDALFGFDPWPAAFEVGNLARMQACRPVVSVVVASTEMIQNRPKDLRRFLKAFALSWFWYAENHAKANALFARAADLLVGDVELDLAAGIEPNIHAKSVGDLRLTFTPADRAAMEDTRKFLVDRGVVAASFSLEGSLDMDPLARALEDPQLAHTPHEIAER